MTAKTKDTKKPMMAVGILALLLIGYFTREKWLPFFTTGKVALSKDTATTPAPTNTSTTNTTKSIDKDKVLKKGDNGEVVKELQRLLNEKPSFHEKLAVDGAFGSKTEAMLVKWTGKKSISINQLIVELAKK